MLKQLILLGAVQREIATRSEKSFQVLPPTKVRGHRILATEDVSSEDSMRQIKSVLGRNSKHSDFLEVMLLQNPQIDNGTMVCPVWEFDTPEKTLGIREYLLKSGFEEVDLKSLEVKK